MIQFFQVTLGALVNLTDVHGTTPFMDLIKNTDVAVKVYRDLNHHQKRVLIDAENCCNETSLWRAMFHGRLDCSEMLINEGANTALAARIQESPADSVSKKLLYIYGPKNSKKSRPKKSVKSTKSISRIFF